MKPFATYQAALRWLQTHATGICYVIVNGHVRGFDPADQRLYVVAEIDITPMW